MSFSEAVKIADLFNQKHRQLVLVRTSYDIPPFPLLNAYVREFEKLEKTTTFVNLTSNLRKAKLFKPTRIVNFLEIINRNQTLTFNESLLELGNQILAEKSDVIIVDDISLLSATSSSTLGLEFTLGKLLNTESSLIVIGATSIPGDIDNNVFLSYLDQFCHCVVSVDTLPSGQCKEITGSVVFLMCGIFASISKQPDDLIQKRVLALLQRRGPDGVAMSQCQAGSFCLSLTASVLCCRSIHCQQPVHENGDIFSWNGEIFGGIPVDQSSNDTFVLWKMLSKAYTIEDIIEILRSVKGPYAFVYWKKSLNSLFFGRDVLGRRSLLISGTKDSEFLISSVLPKSTNHLQVEELLPTGVFCLNLTEENKFSLSIFRYQWPSNCGEDVPVPKSLRMICGENISVRVLENQLFENVSCLVSLPNQNQDANLRMIGEKYSSNSMDSAVISEIFHQTLLRFPEIDYIIDEFIEVLKQSVRVRCVAIPSCCLNCCTTCHHCKVGVLFSGGLDSTIITCLVDEMIQDTEVDLINVAFHKDDVVEIASPDRETAESVFGGLPIDSDKGKFDLKRVNIAQSMLEEVRKDRIRELILPCDSILDDSLGCALWFATATAQFPGKILFHGLGADELFGGYSRHREAFQAGGWPEVGNSLLSDLSKLPYRNLGRDDRVATDNSRELRHPFLDENVINFVNKNIPIYLRLNPYLPRSVGDKLFLRFAALKLSSRQQHSSWCQGLLKAAGFPKRAIQFGSRIAHIEKSSLKSSNRKINASAKSEKLVGGD